MRRALRNHWQWLLIVVLLIGMATRVAWIASHTDTGWQTIASDWREATEGQFVGLIFPFAKSDNPGFGWPKLIGFYHKSRRFPI